MPTYQYKCSGVDCGKMIEETRPVRLYAATTRCPACGAPMDIQVFPVPGRVCGTYVDPTTGDKSHLRFKP